MKWRSYIIYGMMACGALLTGCIEPPLHLPDGVPQVETEIKIDWQVDIDWNNKKIYGWLFDDAFTLEDLLAYPDPSNYEVRRYYLGNYPNGPHTPAGLDAFTVFGKRFKRSYQYGFYDLLIWSNIDSEDETQVLVVDDSDLDAVTATTTVTRGMLRAEGDQKVTALYNQPEIFYAGYPRNVEISDNPSDYDYFDEEAQVWVKRISATLFPRVYIYLVQVVLYNNDGRITGTTGETAISGFASGTNVNTGHTNNKPCQVYFDTAMRRNVSVEGRMADVAAGRLTTFGLCDMESYVVSSKSEYKGGRPEVNNYLYVPLQFRNGTQKTITVEVTDQCQSQCHGGVITVFIDCGTIPIPEGSGGGNVFVPTVEDYEEVDYDIEM